MKYYILILLCALALCCRKRDAVAPNSVNTVTYNLNAGDTLYIGQVACTSGKSTFNERLLLRLDSSSGIQNFILTYSGLNNANVSRTGIGQIVQITNVGSVGDVALTSIPTANWVLNVEATTSTGYMIRHEEPGQNAYTYTGIYVSSYIYNSSQAIIGVTLQMENPIN